MTYFLTLSFALLQGIRATICICDTPNCNLNESEWCACPRDLQVCQQCGGAGLAGKDDYQCRSTQDTGVSAYCPPNYGCFYQETSGKMSLIQEYLKVGETQSW